ncbi:MAG TPA: hypothetical protein VF147_03390, partial [Vicinamibacterales bacterium]
MPLRVALSLLLLCLSARVWAQDATLRLQVRGPEGPVNATVTVQGRDYRTAEGSLVITVTPGTMPIVATAERLAPATVEVTIAAGETRDLVITLEA